MAKKRSSKRKPRPKTPAPGQVGGGSAPNGGQRPAQPPPAGHHRDDEPLLSFLLARIDNHFQLVTLKASLILPADVVLLALLISSLGKEVPPGLADEKGWLSFGLGLGAVVAIFLSLVFSAWATSAFLKSGDSAESRPSLLFFGSIAGMESDDFRRRVEGRSVSNLEVDLATQVHLLSQTLVRKFRYVNRSIFCLLLGIVLAIAQAVLLRLG